MAGTLYVVGTPIGNLEDFSPRAQRVLAEVDLIAAEDTRHTGKLLQHFGIGTPQRALHAHNESEMSARLIGELGRGLSLALVSDAGMPLISDPGFRLVQGARDAGIAVEVVPGPSACIAALAVAGLPADRFVFEGFLPAKTAARKVALEAMRWEPRTIVLYESPHRLAACLADIAEVLGPERELRLARELTKRFESVLAGGAAELAEWAGGNGADRKGEFVIIVRGADQAPPGGFDEARLIAALSAEMPARRVARVVAELTGGRANDIYKRMQQPR